MTDLTGTRAFEYNRYGQLIAENVTLKLSDDANAKPLKYKIERTYTSQNQPDGVFLKTDQTSAVQIDHQVTYQWNKLGQLTAVTSPAGTFEYGYEKQNPGLLKSITAPAHTVHYAYEPDRNLITSVINETRVGTIVPNRPQSPSAEAHPQNNPVHPVQKDPGKVILSRYDYHNDTLGRRTKIAQTGLAFQQLTTGENRIDITYNDRSEVIGTKTLTSADPQSLSDFDVQSSTFDVQRSEGFAFDAIGNRLNQKTVSSDQPSEISYETNALNQYKKIVSSGQISADQRPSAVNPANTPGAATEARDHDLDGNLLEDERNHYTWNAENRLIAVESKDGKSRTEHSYDYQGRRTTKTTFVGKDAKSQQLIAKSYYLYDGWNLLAEVTTSSSPSPALNPESRPLNLSQPHTVRTYTWGRDLSGTLQGAGGVGGLLAISETTSPDFGVQRSTSDELQRSKNRFAIFDANGNIGQMIAEDSSIKAGYQYSAFGSVTATFGEEAESNPWRFSTKPVEADTGWSYYGFRYYDAEQGRWMSRDPIEEEGGVNLYGFVGNDAIDVYDVLGNGWREAVAAIAMLFGGDGESKGFSHPNTPEKTPIEQTFERTESNSRRGATRPANPSGGTRPSGGKGPVRPGVGAGAGTLGAIASGAVIGYIVGDFIVSSFGRLGLFDHNEPEWNITPPNRPNGNTCAENEKIVLMQQFISISFGKGHTWAIFGAGDQYFRTWNYKEIYNYWACSCKYVTEYEGDYFYDTKSYSKEYGVLGVLGGYEHTDYFFTSIMTAKLSD